MIVLKKSRFRLISVESRKGGVGKTTIALCMGKEFLKTFNVVFLDIDIAGTGIAPITKDSAWRDNVHLVEICKGEIAISCPKEKIIPLNLVQLFNDFMGGRRSLPDIEVTQNDSPNPENEKIFLNPGKINLFNSDISDQDHGKIHYEPPALFDEMRSKFFIQMLKELVNKCEKAMSKSNNRELAVIIDNAPGYSGLEPLVEEWVSDMGPECGKILFVSSQDSQDLKACQKAVEKSARRFISKYNASKTFNNEILKLNKNEKSAKETDNEIKDYEKLNKEEKHFFHRLLKTAPEPMNEVGEDLRHSQCTECELCFYRKSEICKILESETPDLSRFMAIIINKLPEIPFNREEFFQIFPEAHNFKLFEKSPADFCIPFAPILLHQFSLALLSDLESQSDIKDYIKGDPLFKPNVHTSIEKAQKTFDNFYDDSRLNQEGYAIELILLRDKALSNMCDETLPYNTAIEKLLSSEFLSIWPYVGISAAFSQGSTHYSLSLNEIVKTCSSVAPKYAETLRQTTEIVESVVRSIKSVVLSAKDEPQDIFKSDSLQNLESFSKAFWPDIIRSIAISSAILKIALKISKAELDAPSRDMAILLSYGLFFSFALNGPPPDRADVLGWMQKSKALESLDLGPATKEQIRKGINCLKFETFQPDQYGLFDRMKNIYFSFSLAQSAFAAIKSDFDLLLESCRVIANYPYAKAQFIGGIQDLLFPTLVGRTGSVDEAEKLLNEESITALFRETGKEDFKLIPGILKTALEDIQRKLEKVIASWSL